MRFLEDRTISNFVNLFLRLLQLVAALVVIALYGVDLHSAHVEKKYSDSKWGYAVAIGSLSAITTVVYTFISLFISYGIVAMAFAWDLILLILWAAVAGVFGSMYLHENPEMDTGVQRMKVAVGFDLASLILWFITGVMSAILYFTSGRRSLHTGRATI